MFLVPHLCGYSILKFMLLGVLCRGTDRERLQLVFQLFDQDRNNTLGQPELVQMLAVLPDNEHFSRKSGVFAVPFAEQLEMWEARTAVVLTRYHFDNTSHMLSMVCQSIHPP